MLGIELSKLNNTLGCFEFHQVGYESLNLFSEFFTFCLKFILELKISWKLCGVYISTFA
jgi:hypothetical protein